MAVGIVAKGMGMTVYVEEISLAGDETALMQTVYRLGSLREETVVMGDDQVRWDREQIISARRLRVG